ncbi:MAG: SDR family oxidoreductase [Dehalococcoidia bacterium]|nr:SDR family oxidoreductase [Dehalococcoidia bacterium]
MKRVLVTGGAGFIGSHLCRRLVADGHEVLCLDNFYTGQKKNVADLVAAPNFELMRHDVTFPFYVEVDEIYNLACPASPVHYQRHPVQTTKTSVHGAINVLGLASRIGAKVLQASTSEVYGDALEHPQREALCFDYNRERDVQVKVVRIFNTYGPNMRPDDGRVVSNFIVQALAGTDITIYGDGSQTRSFCYVSDLVEALVRTMATGPSCTGPINLGNPNEFSIAELACAVCDLVGRQCGVVSRPLPLDDPKHRQPDITMAKSVLGWEPRVQLRDGLARTIEYFRSCRF